MKGFTQFTNDDWKALKNVCNEIVKHNRTEASNKKSRKELSSDEIKKEISNTIQAFLDEKNHDLIPQRKLDLFRSIRSLSNASREIRDSVLKDNFWCGMTQLALLPITNGFSIANHKAYNKQDAAAWKQFEEEVPDVAITPIYINKENQEPLSPTTPSIQDESEFNSGNHRPTPWVIAFRETKEYQQLREYYSERYIKNPKTYRVSDMTKEKRIVLGQLIEQLDKANTRHDVQSVLSQLDSSPKGKKSVMSILQTGQGLLGYVFSALGLMLPTSWQRVGRVQIMAADLFIKKGETMEPEMEKYLDSKGFQDIKKLAVKIKLHTKQDSSHLFKLIVCAEEAKTKEELVDIVNKMRPLIPLQTVGMFRQRNVLDEFLKSIAAIDDKPSYK